TELRLMSIHQFADLFSRPLRDLARRYGKQVELQVAGGTIEADISLLERLREPLTHIFRNCLAHGIESAERRSQLGKPPAGKIILDARRQGAYLEMRIADDGQGIDRDAVVDFLKHRRGMGPAAIESLPSSAFYETILDPEFSTATQLSELAGRGIGMHAVLQAMTFLGGTLAIQSQPYQGTQYTLRLPLSLSAIDALIFRLGEYVLAIPGSRITKIDQIQYAQPSSFGPPPNVACHDLAKLFKLTPSRRKSYYLLYLQHSPAQPGEGKIPQTCIAVDQVIGSRSLMVLPPGKLLARAGIYSGVGILEDGTLAPIIDTDGWFPSSSGRAPAFQTGGYLLG
ncbi:MAG: ATP-binding protein, partial [Desulfobacterales bacterium]